MTTTDLTKKLLELKDFSSKINLGINSYPGVDEKIIGQWVFENHPQDSFYIKIKFGKDMGTTAKGNSIVAGKIFIINPSKTTGFLWWKRVRTHVLHEPDWTLFKEETKPIKDEDVEKLSSLLF